MTTDEAMREEAQRLTGVADLGARNVNALGQGGIGRRIERRFTALSYKKAYEAWMRVGDLKRALSCANLSTIYGAKEEECAGGTEEDCGEEWPLLEAGNQE